MRLLEFWYCRYTLSIAIAVLLVLLTIYKRNISHIANSVALCLLHYRVDNRGMCGSRSEWRCCDLQLQPPHQLCNPRGFE